MSFCMRCGRYTSYPDANGCCQDCSPSDKQLIMLDNMDGFEFEDVCKRILERLGYGHVEKHQRASDEGRDLIVHGRNQEKIVVECKHHPRSTVGRPVVQKLHSAALTAGARKAMLITTGTFSEGALRYAHSISDVNINMIDWTKLLDFADRAGIRLATSEKISPVTAYHVSDLSILTKKVLLSLIPLCMSSPYKITDILKIQPKKLELNPIYVIRFNVHQDFRTTIGRIHSIHVDDQILVIDATDGSEVPYERARFIMNNIPVDTSQIPKFAFHVDRHEFSVGLTTIKDHTKRLIARVYTENIAYYGENNVRYVRTCIPGPNSMLITDIKQTYYPKWESYLSILQKNYDGTFLENQDSILMLNTTIDRCVTCGEKVQRMLVCNDCGNMAHPPKRFGAHSHVCRSCGKTICKHCTYWSRRWLFLRRKICRECGIKLQAKGMKINKLLV